ncbi:hypothetical protein C0Q70_11912 [Pomacea canaliculata]|uniref:EF-hand domain-containing protein n=1 Tax=Pomacea canaliculata TaxID=400727 RepID=A0A2T7P7A8_POMCA|nr:hypothetical protein C0Q70_11912 [Pomacea canaliculata]
MALEGLQEELEFLTGRYAMRRRPVHGHLFSKPTSSRSHRPTLDDISIAGTKMTLPKQKSFPAFWPDGLPHTSPPLSSTSARSSSDAEQQVSAHHFMNFVSSPPRVRHLIASKEGLDRRHEDDDVAYLGRSHRAYTSPLLHPQDASHSRSLHLQLPRTVSGSPRPLLAAQLREAPAMVWEEEEELEEYEEAQAQEVCVREMVISVQQPAAARDSVGEAVVVRTQRQSDDAPDEEGDAASSPPTSPEEDVSEDKQSKTKLKTGDKPATKPTKAQASPDKAAKQPVALKPLARSTNHLPVKTTKPLKQVISPKAKAADRRGKKAVAKTTSKTMVMGKLKEHRPASEEPVDKPKPLPISLPEDMETGTDTQVSPEPPKSRSPTRKKEKVIAPPPQQLTALPDTVAPPKVVEVELTKRSSWIFGENDDDDKEERDGENLHENPGSQIDRQTKLDRRERTLPYEACMCRGPPCEGGPAGPALHPACDIPARSTCNPRGGRTLFCVPIAALTSKQRWGRRQRDTSLQEEEERARLGEERRRRHQNVLDRRKAHARLGLDKTEGSRDTPHYDDYGFLAKYCILTPATTDKYRYTFESVDEVSKGYLTEEETAYGLRAINPSLSTSERTYLFRVLEMVGHKMSKGTDLKLFSILAALSQRVSRLDEWARNMMSELDYRNLERKLFLCKTLWECNVDNNTNTISLDQLIVELRAGGVSPAHEEEVRCKLGYLRSLDFFDFLMYVPLFIMIHQSVVNDPLSDTRNV